MYNGVSFTNVMCMNMQCLQFQVTKFQFSKVYCINIQRFRKKIYMNVMAYTNVPLDTSSFYGQGPSLTASYNTSYYASQRVRFKCFHSMSLEFEHIDIPFQYVVWRTMTRLNYQHKYGPGTTHTIKFVIKGKPFESVPVNPFF